MSAYAVRYADTKWLLGFYEAEDLDILWELVDEHVEPEDFEFLPITNGGIFIASETEAHTECGDDDVGFPGWDDPHQPRGPHKLGMTDNFAGQLIKAYDRNMWKRFDVADLGRGLAARVITDADRDNLRAAADAVGAVIAEMDEDAMSAYDAEPGAFPNVSPIKPEKP